MNQYRTAFCRPNRRNPAAMPMMEQMDFALAMAYIMVQSWGQTYEPATALKRGTIFPELDLPFCCGGCCK